MQELRELKPGEAYVIDIKRPRKTKWIWTIETFNRYEISNPGRYKIVSDRKVVIEDNKVKVKDVPEYLIKRLKFDELKNKLTNKGNPEARKKKDHKK